MKRLIAVICILLVIFISMYINKINVNKNVITVSEVEKIEEYISQIYMWQEVTEQALPKFSNINNAPEIWVWEVVKNNLENYELTYEEIQEKAIQIFGENFTKEFPKEGTKYIEYSNDENKYFSKEIDLDSLDDTFLIKNIEKTKNGYQVEIVEYLEDYEEALKTETNDIYNIYIKNLQKETIAQIKSNESEINVIELVKQNIDKFSTKKITLQEDSQGNIYIEKVE